MKTLLVLLMTLSLSACSSTGGVRDKGQEIGQPLVPNKHENNGKGPYGPGRSS